MKINRVTVTGADDSISPLSLADLAEEFPFVEFGILMSQKNSGIAGVGTGGIYRFPSRTWLRALECLPATMKLSAHICGAWVREIFMGQWPVRDLEILLGRKFFERFGRWQLNTHGQYHNWGSAFLASLGYGPGTVIFQYDNQNNAVLHAARARGINNIATLFDLSPGAGTLPETWPVPFPGVPCGYAGGLSPENVAEECAKIAEVVGDGEIWIDAETHLRSVGGTIFDLEKVRNFLMAAKPFVTGQE